MTDLRTFLREAGAPDDEIDQAVAEGWLPLLAIDRILVPGTAVYDLDGLVEAAGVDREFAERLWHAMGFPDVPEGLTLFTERDRIALRRAADRVSAPADIAAFLRQVQAISAAMSRVGAIDADLLAEGIAQLRAAGLSEEAVAQTLVDQIDWSSLAELLDYVHRVQARSAVWRRLTREAFADLDVAVGFADLVGYTALSAELEPAALTDLLGRWEDVAFGCTAREAGRVVKTIGDEVMFSALPDAALEIALGIVEGSAGDPALPSVRVGVASGSVIARGGDFYGPVVNLASRLSEIAPADVVLASAALYEQFANDERFRWRAQGERWLHGIGPVEVYSVDHGGR